MSNGPQDGMWPSPFNRAKGQLIAPGRRILISDCTLRDGEQQAGVVLDRTAKVAIARASTSLGIYEIEAGTVASSEEDRLAIAEMCQLGLQCEDQRALPGHQRATWIKRWPWASGACGSAFRSASSSAGTSSRASATTNI